MGDANEPVGEYTGRAAEQYLDDVPPPQPLTRDDARPCMADGCDWPGRFILGIDGGTSACWCIRHVNPDGIKWLIGFVDGVRDCLPPRWLDDHAE